MILACLCLSVPRIVPIPIPAAAAFVARLDPSCSKYDTAGPNVGSIAVLSSNRVSAVALLERSSDQQVWVWDITAGDLESGTGLVATMIRSGYPIRFMDTVHPRFRIAARYFNDS